MSGMMAVYSTDHNEDIYPYLYHGIMSLQHRGQEGYGFVVQDTAQYGNGLLADAVLNQYKGHQGMAYVKYAFTQLRKQAPLMPQHQFNTFIAYDGILDERSINLDDPRALHQKLLKHDKAFALVAMDQSKLIAMRDRHGVKPMVIGSRGNKWFLASESCALESINASDIRDLKAGEMVVIDESGLISYEIHHPKLSPCLFEYIYIARPDSTMNDISVYEARKRMGEILYQECPTDADLVIGSPDSGLIAALGYANASKIPYEKGIVKNRYIGRTFIDPDSVQRQKSVNIKLSAIPAVVSGKDVILVDDSIVRGTTIRKLIQILRDHGAHKVHVRISSPPILYEENSSLDIPNKEDLMSNGKTVEQVCKAIGADSLYYLSIEGLKKAVGKEHYYTQYFDGKSPFIGEDNDL